MNEMPTLPDHNAASAAAPVAPQNEAPAGALPPAAPPAPVPVPPSKPSLDGSPGLKVTEILQNPMKVSLIVIAVLLAAHAISTRNSMLRLRTDVAASLQKSELSVASTAATVRTVQDLSRDLQAKITLLDNRQQESQSQQLALEQLYQDLSKNRDEWALAEIEQVISTASQQLQLSGNVQGALIALQNAERSLAHSDKPQFITIRRALAKDTDKLKALPSVDLIGVALRIDTVIAQIDTLPMLADATPALPAPAAKPPQLDKQGKVVVAAPTPTPDGFLSRARASWQSWTGDMWNEMRSLIRVRRVGTPEALMLSPEQTYFLRENLKLRLLNARLALMSRNEVAFRSDLVAAQDVLSRYFDARTASTMSAQSLLRQVQASNVAIEMPTLNESLNAVRNYKSKP